MEVVLLIIGFVLILLSFVDALWTTFWVDNGAGPLAKRLAYWTWRGMKKLIGTELPSALSIVGPTVLLLSILLWVTLLWAGWTMVFSSDPEALVFTGKEGMPDLVGRIYFVGYSIFTMGNGDFSPTAGVWQLATAVMTGSGMFMVTLAITYTISVVGAVVQKRGFASQITGIGKTPEEFVIRGWNGHDLRSHDLPLNSIVGELSMLTHQYRAYPILQYFHPSSSEDSPSLAVAVLDDALTIFSHGVPDAIRPNPVTLHSGRSAVSQFLRTMPGALIGSASEAPRVPDLKRLRSAGVPTGNESGFDAAVADRSEERRKVLGLVRNNGWQWPR